MKLGRDTGEACLTSAIPSRTTPGMGVYYEIDDDFEEARYTNPFPTADDEPDEDPQEVCRSGEDCWVGFRSPGLKLALVAGEDSDATDDMLFWVLHRRLRIHRHRAVLGHRRARFDISLNGWWLSSSISFSISESSFCLSSTIVPSPSRTCGDGCGECCFDLAESTCCPLPLKSMFGRDCGTGGDGATPRCRVAREPGRH